VITAKDVQRLRHATGSGMMDAKRALEEVGGDFEQARDLLRERGVADAKARSGRVQTEGAIGHYLHYQAQRPVLGVLVELASETDFVAKSDDFQEAARDIAMHVAWARPRWVEREDVPADVVDKETTIVEAQARNEGKPTQVIERIVAGKMAKFYADTVLYDQPFVNQEKHGGTIGDMVQQMSATMGENIGVRNFIRMAVGEDAAE